MHGISALILIGVETIVPVEQPKLQTRISGSEVS